LFRIAAPAVAAAAAAEIHIEFDIAAPPAGRRRYVLARLGAAATLPRRRRRRTRPEKRNRLMRHGNPAGSRRFPAHRDAAARRDGGGCGGAFRSRGEVFKPSRSR
jgi:hypothetical protein